MAGASLGGGDEERLGTMAVTTSREAAQEYVKGAPFHLNATTREWADTFA